MHEFQGVDRLPDGMAREPMHRCCSVRRTVRRLPKPVVLRIEESHV
jgi:hypothetical protein